MDAGRWPTLLMTACAGALLGFALTALPGCDPLYEPPFDGGFRVCCANEQLTTCACGRSERCLFVDKACAAGACAEQGRPCPPGGGLDAGIPPDAGMPDAGTVTGYAVCCSGNAVTSCPCTDGVCPPADFQPCAGGRCAAAGGGCPLR